MIGIARIKIIKQVNLLINEINPMPIGIKKIKKLKELNELLSKLGLSSKTTEKPNQPTKIIELLNKANAMLSSANFSVITFQEGIAKTLSEKATEIDQSADEEIKILAQEVREKYFFKFAELANSLA